MPSSPNSPSSLLGGGAVVVIDATAGIGRSIATRLCAAGATVAVVGVGHPARADDAARSAAFLCKKLADSGLVALPYQANLHDMEEFRALPGQVAADLGPVAASVVVIPDTPEPDSLETDSLVDEFRAVSAAVASALPEDARHIELIVPPGTTRALSTAQALVENLVSALHHDGSVT